MILLVVQLAQACDTEASLAALRTSAYREDYLCLARATSGETVLRAAIPREENANARARFTRALVLWLLERGDQPLPVEDVLLLSADDRRLLADGIYARAGRPSPSPEHAKVFEQQGWYHPDPHFTNGRLSPLDRANIALADKPPEPPVVAAPQPAPVPTEPPVADPPEAPKSWFGCATVNGPASLLLPLLSLLAFAHRPRQRPAP